MPAAPLARCGERRSIYLEEWLGSLWQTPGATTPGLYCAVRHADDPVRCLVRAARTSGDSDSIGALAGVFAGAAHGLAAWPADWVARIEHADQLAALTSGSATTGASGMVRARPGLLSGSEPTEPRLPPDPLVRVLEFLFWDNQTFYQQIGLG